MFAQDRRSTTATAARVDRQDAVAERAVTDSPKVCPYLRVERASNGLGELFRIERFWKKEHSIIDPVTRMQ
jgi:hypothetical protein